MAIGGQSFGLVGCENDIVIYRRNGGIKSWVRVSHAVKDPTALSGRVTREASGVGEEASPKNLAVSFRSFQGIIDREVLVFSGFQICFGSKAQMLHGEPVIDQFADRVDADPQVQVKVKGGRRKDG